MAELETALLILPPRKVQVFSYPLRDAYDSEAADSQLPAHITLLYPFVPPDKIEETIPRLEKLLKDCSPFELTLDRYGRFEGTIFLEPSDPEPVLELYEHLAREFPEYPIYGGEHGPDLHPHLTLARSDDPADLSAIELPPTPSFTFLVERLHLYLGSADSEIPFVPRAVIPLGGAG
ncbi:MAG: 2'-5' RNA ligase family protein [Anaerolineales bacterium]|jgi:2'-5' RNA ligase